MARHYCQKCTKPEKACICKWLSPQANSIAVLVLQHPDEQKKAIGTAKLVTLGLINSKVLTSLQVAENEVLNILGKLSCSQPLLIYPQSLNDEQLHYVYDFEKERFTSLPLQKAYDSIILLDGTWRNSRELLHYNTWLKQLPTLNLKNIGESRYRIRQAKQAGALATIEAVSKVLGLLEESFKSKKLLLPFEKMIEYQIEKMGLEVYQQNYKNNNE
ncbi:MAG: DTW domain-containing protein YfiP [Oleiphilaceae bacterium]|jgi:DTW domain-containing protein YfiP